MMNIQRKICFVPPPGADVWQTLAHIRQAVDVYEGAAKKAIMGMTSEQTLETLRLVPSHHVTTAAATPGGLERLIASRTTSTEPTAEWLTLPEGEVNPELQAVGSPERTETDAVQGYRRNFSSHSGKQPPGQQGAEIAHHIANRGESDGPLEGVPLTSGETAATERYDTILDAMSTALHGKPANQHEDYAKWIADLEGLEKIWDTRAGEFDPYVWTDQAKLRPDDGNSDHELLLSLMSTYREVEAEGGAISIAKIAARYIIQDLKALDSKFTVGDPEDNDWIVRNWDTELDELDMEWVGFSKADGSLIDGRKTVAQWDGSKIYAVRTRMAEGGLISVRTERGTMNVNRWVFAEILKWDLDNALDRLDVPDAPEIPIVLAFSHAGSGGLELPRTVAAITGRKVWAASGEVIVTKDPFPMLALIDHQSIDSTRGEWIESGPYDLLQSPAGSPLLMATGHVRTADGDEVADEDIHSHTVIDEITKELVGRMSYAASGDLARAREIAYARWRNITDSGLQDADGKAIDPPQTAPVPWLGQKPYFFSAHGTPGFAYLTQRDGSTIHQVDGKELGGYLKRRPSFSQNTKPLVLQVCFAAAAPIEGGLDNVSTAQHVANATGRKVFAPTTKVTAYTDRSMVLTDNSPDGKPPRWEACLPEPEGVELDSVARDAGLHRGTGRADDTVRAQTLRGVRALRQVFGYNIGQVPRDYAALLCGATAVETMWRGNGLTEPFSSQKLENILDGYVRTVLGSGKVTSELRKRALLAAAKDLSGGPRERQRPQSTHNSQTPRSPAAPVRRPSPNTVKPTNRIWAELIRQADQTRSAHHLPSAVRNQNANSRASTQVHPSATHIQRHRAAPSQAHAKGSHGASKAHLDAPLGRRNPQTLSEGGLERPAPGRELETDVDRSQRPAAVRGLDSGKPGESPRNSAPDVTEAVTPAPVPSAQELTTAEAAASAAVASNGEPATHGRSQSLGPAEIEKITVPKAPGIAWGEPWRTLPVAPVLHEIKFRIQGLLGDQATTHTMAQLADLLKQTPAGTDVAREAHTGLVNRTFGELAQLAAQHIRHHLDDRSTSRSVLGMANSDFVLTAIQDLYVGITFAQKLADELNHRIMLEITATSRLTICP
ncbi:lonely Cys domain-containing protein [Streptomyces adustus]|uniref:Lonely Cys domain-containing protein n=1 Tax=Streptomyces adustus TaxID=1609272 RepID=A0A5N8V4Z0_9ACTN|nr:lonely Cys domain-containing protein [Streptomyces adustus]MPY30243.1 lonely Cys domain-containing protein [Streptomyces adustus]